VGTVATTGSAVATTGSAVATADSSVATAGAAATASAMPTLGSGGTAGAAGTPGSAPAVRSTAPGSATAGLAAAGPATATAGALTRPLVYVAIGASDTVGIGADDPARNGWVPQFARLLGSSIHVHNLGSSGTLLRTARQDQLPVAIGDQPDLVTVWLAVNDLNAGVPLDQYRADLDGLLASLGSQTHAVVLVANVPDLTRVPQYRGQDPTALRTVVQQWNQAIADTTARRGAHLVDLYAEYAELAAHPEDLSSDGFHPSSAGYARLAELFFEVARPLLRS